MEPGENNSEALPGTEPQPTEPAKDAKLEVVGSPKPSPADLARLRGTMEERRARRLANLRPPWRRGQSGNPTGHNGMEDIRGMARRYTAEALGKAIHLLRNSRDERIQAAMAQWIIDRGYGKAPQLVGVVTPHELPIEFTVEVIEGGADASGPGP